MARVAFRGSLITTVGDLPAVGSIVPDSLLITSSLEKIRLSNLRGSPVVINIFPSIDTPVCAASVREFNERLRDLPGVVVLQVSVDLPFAQMRFCASHGLTRVRTASAFRGAFGEEYGVRMLTGPLPGLLARAVVVVDEAGRVVHTELVPDISDEPDYDAALRAATAH